jgi:hypothetical protein
VVDGFGTSSDIPKLISIFIALHITVSTWNKVNGTWIVSCFRKSGLMYCDGI